MENFELSVKRFDEYAKEYAQHYVNLESYADSINKFLSLIKNDQPKILELGCGPGNVTRLLKHHFPESKITALDLAPNMIDLARQQLPDVDFRLMDVRNISTLTGKFDAVMCSFCLPFLSKSDARQLIADCAYLLIRQGVIYISTMEGDASKAGFESTRFSGNSEIYFNYHRQQDIVHDLENAGFEISHLKLQDYPEADGRVSTDMIFIGKKGL